MKSEEPPARRTGEPELDRLLRELERCVSGHQRALHLTGQLRGHIRELLAKQGAGITVNAIGEKPGLGGAEPARRGVAAAAGSGRESAPVPAPTPVDFRAIFEGLPALYMILDPDLRVVAASDAYLEATLTRREEIVGRDVFEVFPDNPNDPSADSIRNSRASFRRVLQTRATDVMVVQRHDVRRPEAEGGGFEVRYWSPVNSPLLNADGSLRYIIHRVENVTDFMQVKQQGLEEAKHRDLLHERFLRSEADLYARSREVAATSLKLKEANEQLSRLYEQTRELVAFKDQLFANVSHELRTPLTLILGPVEKLLAAGELSSVQRHELNVVRRNARTLVKTVNDLLDLSRLDAGQLPVDYVSTDLARMAAFVAAHFESSDAAKQIRFTTELPPSLPARVDAPKVQRILFNLIGNAFKFTPVDGAVRFSLRADDAHAVFVVEDSGPGVPRDQRDQIFERFRQGEGVSRSGGTGLGLAIVKEFVELLRGSVEVADAFGGGARFTVRIPVEAPAGAMIHPDAIRPDETAVSAAAELGTAALPLAPHLAAHPVGTPLVLVVEDNPEMNAFTVGVLATRYDVVTAADGREGLEMALRLRPDLIVCDAMMSRFSGEDLLRELRSRRDLDNIRIVMLTARADEAYRVHLLSSGAQDYLVKPFAADELLARVTGHIDRKRKAEHELRESEERYRTLFDSIDEGYCIIEMRIEPGEPLDYRFIEMNASFERQSTLVDAKGRWMRELRPEHEEKWFEIYRDVALTGTPVRFELGGRALENRWFTLYAFRFGAPEQRRVAVLFNDITARKRAEEALRDATAEAQRRATEAEAREQIFTALMDHIPMGITIADAPDVVIRAVSRYGRELLAKPEAAIAGIPASEHPERWDIFRMDGVTPATPEELPLTRATQHGEVVEQEEWVVGRSDGVRIPILCTAGPIRDREGRIVGGVIGWQDITARKTAEVTLRRGEQRFRSLVTASAQMVWSTDGRGQVIQPMPSWAEYTGQTEDEVLGDGWLQALHPDDFAGAVAAWHEALGRRQGYATEYRVRRRDGVYRTFAVRGVPVFAEDGEVREWIGACSDITERRAAEDELQRTAERLAALNRLGRIMSSNLELGKVFGEFAREMHALFEFGRTTYIAVHPEQDEWEVLHRWSRVSDPLPVGSRGPLRGTSVEWVAREKRPLVENEIDARWAEAALARDLGTNSRVLLPLLLNDAVIGVFSISSQRRGAFPPDVVQFLEALADHLVVAAHNARLYAEVQEYATELEQKVAHRTAQLEAANRELEAFSYSVSHDLRAPLRAVAGFAAILVDEHAATMSPAAARYAGLVQNAARKMGRLIDDLLAFSRLGRQAISVREVDIARMFREVAVEVQGDYPARRVQLRIDDLPPCQADPSLLRQVVTNLLSNAFKYTGPRDPAVVEVGGAVDGAVVTYHVKDNGVGFDMAYASKLFGVFQRLHRAEEFEGTGVGLAIVQRIIHRHGGRIWAESAVNQGTTFYFTLAGTPGHGKSHH